LAVPGSWFSAASEHALGQGQLGFHRAAARARSAGRIPAVGDDELAAVPYCLVAEHPPRLPEALVGDGAG
jgi:hypothetical protein